MVVCKICGNDITVFYEIEGKQVCLGCYQDYLEAVQKKKLKEMVGETSEGKPVIQAKKVIVHEGKKDDALEILKKRLARSEITIDEFYEKVKFEKGKHNAMDILRKRLAKGEITKEEFYELILLL